MDNNQTMQNNQPAPAQASGSQPLSSANTGFGATQQQPVIPMAPQHLMGLMANPAYAASNLFPPSAVISNPGAFLAMQPEAFGVVAQPQAQQQLQSSTGLALPNPHHLNPLAPSQMIYPPVAPERKKKDEKTKSRSEMTSEERAKQNRDRNREHARSTRLRKKAYVQKLKELVDGLHAERTEEVRQRRVAIQHLAEVQNVRKGVVRSFLRFHSKYESDERKWNTIMEENFWLKQPVTPYRSFQRAEIEKECRISRGIGAIICDAASLSVMMESIGCKASRWLKLKREEFLTLEASKRGSRKMPRCITRQESRLQTAVSSLSSSSDSSNNSKHHHALDSKPAPTATRKKTKSTSDKVSNEPTKVSSSSGSGSGSDQSNNQQTEFHDYHASEPLPDPKLRDSERSSGESPSEDSPEESGDGDGKRISDCSSGDDSAAEPPRAAKRRKTESVSVQSYGGNSLPPNIAKKGGIPHNIRPAVSSISNGVARLRAAPAVALPPFSGIGKQTASEKSYDSIKVTAPKKSTKGPALITADLDASSNEDSSAAPRIQACYHVNEDDMILMEDVLMCPFVFRSQDAVLCGAFAECVMPGMLRAHFSSRNKLDSMELVYDAMGFMQQLERASGNEGTAQIVAGSLEMALAPSTSEARVITLAKPPFMIVNVNELWTRMTGYTQMEVEGREFQSLLEGEGTVQESKTRQGRPPHNLEMVAEGNPACSTNIHYDSDGRDFIEFVCSYPLTNSNNDITHLLHVCRELPSFLHDSPDQ